MKHSRVLLVLFVCIGTCLLLSASNRVDNLEVLQTKFEEFVKRNPQLKLHLTFNQPLYCPDDTVFFNAWYLDESNHMVAGNQIGTVDLITSTGKTIHRQLFKIKAGRASNQIVLPKDLTAGNYQIKAYTHQMKALGSAAYFSKELPIVKKNNLTPLTSSELVQFFSEGGNFVAGVPNRIVALGNKNLEVTVQDDTNSADTIRIKFDEYGVGIFTLTPKLNSTYNVRINGILTQTNFPLGKSDGLALQVDSGPVCTIHLQLPPQSSLAETMLSALVISQGKIVAKRAISMDNSNKAEWSFQLNEKLNSPHQVVVFNEINELIAERVFIPSVSNSLKVEVIGSDKLRQREQAPYEIRVTDTFGNPVAGNVSVTVYQKGLFENSAQLGQFTYIELPELDELLKNRSQQGVNPESINAFLISLKWKRLDWKRILSEKTEGKAQEISYQRAFEGRVVSKLTGASAPDSMLVLTYLHENAMGFESYTKGGVFILPFEYDFWGQDRLFCTLIYNGKSVDDEYVIMPVLDHLKDIQFSLRKELNSQSPYGMYQFNKQLAAESYGFYGLNKNKPIAESVNPNKLLEEEFNEVDYSVRVDEYLTFANMEELLREIVPFVKAKMRADQYRVQISYRFETSAKIYRDDPIYIIDGLMTRNSALFMSLRPEDVVTLKVINNPNKLAQLGKLGANGVIFIQTKGKKYDMALLTKNIFPIIGLSMPIKELTHIPHVNKRIPDLRATIAWIPNVEISTGKSVVNLTASDDVGALVMRVEGFTESGIPVRMEKELNVEFAENEN